MNSDLEITNSIKMLREGGIIVYPGETGWSLGCDLKNTEAVDAIFKSDLVEYPCILLNETGQLGKYVKELPDVVWDLVEFTSKPLQLIMNDVLNIPQSILPDKEATFRIVKDTFTKNILYKFGKPVFTAVLKNQMQPEHEKTILNKPAYIVNLRSGAKLSTENLVIIKLSNGNKIEILKK